MNIFKDNRIVMTLDAGGTNFVFNAIQGGELLLDPIRRPAHGDDLEKCLQVLIEGFKLVQEQLHDHPVAISFAFPGPADYSSGVIGDLGNLPAFRGGIALGPMLSEHFNLPVFIQNDGDLYAYGEALGGALREINLRSKKTYKNLIGITLGTGFGAGFVLDGKLLRGDNNIGGEVWLLSNVVTPKRNAEEGVSARAIVKSYTACTNTDSSQFQPKDIYDIAKGNVEGDKVAARESFNQFGLHLGDAIANLITLFDGIVVIGGGLTGASELYMPAVMDTLNGTFDNGQKRLVQEVFNCDDPKQYEAFLRPSEQQVTVPFSDTKVDYDPSQKLAITTSKTDASEMISLGAYAYALSQIDEK